MKKKIALIRFCGLTSLIFLNACSTSESFKEKMGRFIPKKSNINNTPSISISDFSFKNTKNSRSPASLLKTDHKSNNKASNNETELNITNKKLYFLSLFTQYENLKHFSKNFSAPEISLCPNFHNGVLELNKKKIDSRLVRSEAFFQLQADSSNFESSDFLNHHPELFLPITREGSTPRVIDILKSKVGLSSSEANTVLQNAIDTHISKTYFEVVELCEHGTSDNYFIYENLLTHTKETPMDPSNENMNILLKTTLFSNLAIIHSLENSRKKEFENNGRSIASTTEDGNSYTNEVIKKMNVEWTTEYFKSLRK